MFKRVEKKPESGNAESGRAAGGAT
jgi:hypothetical protein